MAPVVKDLQDEDQGTNIETCCSTVQRSRHLQVLFLNEPMHLVPAPPMQSWSKRGMLQFINWKHTFIHNAEVESIAFVINQCVHVNLRAWPKPSCLDHMPQSSTHDIFHENVQTRGRFVPSMFCWIRCAYNTQSDLVTCSWCPKWTGDPPMAVFFQWHNGKKHAKSRNTSKRKLRTISASSPHSPPEIAHKPLELSESTGQALNQRKTEIWWSQIRFWRTWSGTIPIHLPHRLQIGCHCSNCCEHQSNAACLLDLLQSIPISRFNDVQCSKQKLVLDNICWVLSSSCSAGSALRTQKAHSHPNKCSAVQSLELDTSGIGRRERSRE